jgi:type IV secretory pathway VirB10-like protein
MTQNNGSRSNHATLIIEDQVPPKVNAPILPTDLEPKPELATRAKLRARQKIQQNRFLIVAAGAVVASETAQNKSEREALEKSSLIFVRNISVAQASAQRHENTTALTEYGLGLPTGTRLRARLESAASTAVRTPVLAVIEYNYERGGEIIIPAGAKAVGQIQEADRSGYMRVQFDSLLLPDGATIPIQAAATDLEMRPVKGRVEGKNTGKNVLVRSLSGIGQAGTMLVGRGSLNQPLSESDLIRERVSNNIGEAFAAQISRLAVTSRVVVSVSAGTPIYVVLEQSSKSIPGFRASTSDAQGATSESVDQLRQLLRLQQELNQTSTKTQ